MPYQSDLIENTAKLSLLGGSWTSAVVKVLLYGRIGQLNHKRQRGRSTDLQSRSRLEFLPQRFEVPPAQLAELK